VDASGESNQGKENAHKWIQQVSFKGILQSCPIQLTPIVIDRETNSYKLSYLDDACILLKIKLDGTSKEFFLSSELKSFSLGSKRSFLVTQESSLIPKCLGVFLLL